MRSNQRRHHWRALFSVLILSSLLGCTGGSAPESTDVPCDTGEVSGDFACVESDENRVDPGADNLQEFAGPPTDDCALLVELSCGTVEAGVSCDDSAACTAAGLLAEYETDSCNAALNDGARFPACTANACEELVIRVCGDLDATAAACSDRTECDLARRLKLRQEGTDEDPPDVNGLNACSAAMEDGVLFPACSL